MKRIYFFIGLLFILQTARAQNWTLIDTGVGLVVEIGSSDKKLKIIHRNTLWDARELSENGAMKGKYKSNQLFAAWMQGPETKEFLNSKGKPTWEYKYKITYPDGKTFESEPKDFYSTGFSYFGIDIRANTEGVWKIEWFIFNRNTQQSSQISTTVFQTTWGSQGQKPKESFKVKSNSQ
jgi:hypothetical protein